MADNFPLLMKDMNTEIWELQSQAEQRQRKLYGKKIEHTMVKR